MQYKVYNTIRPLYGSLLTCIFSESQPRLRYAFTINIGPKILVIAEQYLVYKFMFCRCYTIYPSITYNERTTMQIIKILMFQVELILSKNIIKFLKLHLQKIFVHLCGSKKENWDNLKLFHVRCIIWLLLAQLKNVLYYSKCMI